MNLSEMNERLYREAEQTALGNPDNAHNALVFDLLDDVHERFDKLIQDYELSLSDTQLVPIVHASIPDVPDNPSPEEGKYWDIARILRRVIGTRTYTQICNAIGYNQSCLGNAAVGRSRLPYRRLQQVLDFCDASKEDREKLKALYFPS